MPVDPAENQLFRWADQLPPALWDDLAARPPEQAAQTTGALWQDGCFALSLLGRPLAVDPAQRRVWRLDQPESRVSYQTGLVLVSTLSRSLGVPPSGRLVTPEELPGGAQFFQGPHAVNKKPLVKRFGHDPQALLERALAMGGEAIEGADVAVKVPGLPMLPLYALLWAGDDEFEARAVVGLDAHAHYHLALDGLWALTNLMVHYLVRDHA
ncbi:MAG: DUF3786 domain-containing protein [Thermodesulfobacteriota bacterium]